VEGLTTFPFRTKWHGLDHVSMTLRRVLTWLSALGLLLMAFSARGRLLLVVMATSLLPYAFTWKIPGGSEWRFTMVAYPFYLVAALLPLVAWGRDGLMRSGFARLPWRGRAPCPPPG
jgi:hypothetical protein